MCESLTTPLVPSCQVAAWAHMDNIVIMWKCTLKKSLCLGNIEPRYGWKECSAAILLSNVGPGQYLHGKPPEIPRYFYFSSVEQEELKPILYYYFFQRSQLHVPVMGHGSSHYSDHQRICKTLCSIHDQETQHSSPGC